MTGLRALTVRDRKRIGLKLWGQFCNGKLYGQMTASTGLSNHQVR